MWHPFYLQAKLFFSSALVSGIYPSNLDVRYTTQKIQSCNSVLKLSLHVYILFGCLVVFAFA